MNKSYYTGSDIQSSFSNSSFMKHFSTTQYGELHLRTLNPFNKTNPTHNFTG